jgi:hypothetical protein
MNTLKEMVRDRKAAEPSRETTSDTAEAPVRALRVHAWNGEQWVLPWGYFYFAQLQSGVDREQLVLRLAHHEVVLEGIRLALLLPEIAGFQLERLRDLPVKFQVDADKSVPFISRVSVRLAMDLAKDDAKTS